MSQLLPHDKAFPLACHDWFDRLKRGDVPITDLDLSLDKASSAIKVFNMLRLPDVVGQPTFGKAGGQWFRDIIAAMFGSVYDSGDRWLREFLLLVPKKNSKTTNGAAIMLTALLLNKRPNAEFLLIGPTQAIADTGFKQACGMIEADTEGYLQKRFNIREAKQEIVDRTNKAVLKIKTFDNKVMTGSKPVGVLLDEIHELGKFHYASKVLEQIRGGIVANPEGFLFMITTQSDEPPTGIFKTELDYARKIRDGKIDGDLLPILYEFPVKMQSDKSKDYLNSKYWHMVHPNLGLSRTLERLEEDFEKARVKGGETLQIWLTQHLNIQLGMSEHKDNWKGAKFWVDAKDPEPITIERLIERCDVITAGIDGGGLDDLLGLCVCGRDCITKDWLFWFRGWAQPEALDRRKESQEKYRQFHEQGDLVICTEPMQDIEELAEICGKINAAEKFPKENAIGLDPVGIAAILSELVEVGISDDQMVQVPQGYRLSGAIKGFERRLKDGRVWHDGSDFMVWVVGNAKTEVRGSATYITKQVSGQAKIDPIIAGFNAFELMSREPEASADGSYLENEPMVYL